MAKCKGLLFKPRDYQLNFLEMAKDQNVIICLGTGSGKTYISIMLIKEYGREIRQEKKKAVFLVPTVPLGQQQAQSIVEHTGESFRTRVFVGGQGPGVFEKRADWLKEFESSHIIVITPDLFLQVLSKNIIDVEQICVMIFDECHHANLKKKSSTILEPTNHAYKKIMNEIIERKMHNRIRLVGLTASVVNNCMDLVHLPQCVDELENTFNAKIIGQFDLDSKFLAEPKIVTWAFEEPCMLNEQLQRIFSIDSKLGQIIRAEEKKEEYYKNALNIPGFQEEKSCLKTSAIAKTIRDLGDVQEELGIYCAYLICVEFKHELKRSLEDFKKFKQEVTHAEIYELIKATVHFFEFFENFYLGIINHSSFGDMQQAIFSLTSNKLLRVLDIFYCFKLAGREPVSLLFVDRVFFSYAIFKYLERLSEFSDFSHLRPKCFVGLNNDYQNFSFIRQTINQSEQTIQDFKARNLNVLVTTAVLGTFYCCEILMQRCWSCSLANINVFFARTEEGIDVGSCNLVIRFSDLQNNREFVQSKGRARAKGSFFVILHSDPLKTNKLIDKFKGTERFLSQRFKKNEKEILLSKGNVLPDNHEVTYEGEIFRLPNGSCVFLSEAAAFLQRYIWKKGDKNYIASYAFEPQEAEDEEPCVAKLNLTGVTPLKDEIKGQVSLGKKDAFKSACLEAIRQLHAIGQLNDNFIPISDDEIVKQSNLGEEYSEAERVELSFVFDRRRPKLMFKKKINDYEYVKSFVKPSGGYDLYEILFCSNDDCLDAEQQRLALFTRLDLNEESFSIGLRNHFNEATFKLVKQDVQLNADELDKVDEFTVFVLRMAVPLFAMSKDPENPKFDSERCLFRFVLTDKNWSINYDQMRKVVFESDSDQGCTGEKLVRPIHTDDQFKLISTSTHTYPDSSYDDTHASHSKSLTFNEFYEKKYGIVICDQKTSLLQVESYSSVVSERPINSGRRIKYHYFPNELCVISTISDLERKASCLPRLIYEIKRRIILRHISTMLNREILKIDNKTFQAPIFRRIPDSNIVDYISEHFQDNQQVSDCSPVGKIDENEETLVREINEAIDYEFDSSKRNKEKSLAQNLQKFQTISSKTNIFYPPADSEKLEKLQHSSMASSLERFCYSDLQHFLADCNFEKLFESIVNRENDSNDLQSSDCPYPDNQTIEPIPESDQLKGIDFNFWKNESSDQQIVDECLLREALTMNEAEKIIDRERLEFFGDVFLKFVTCNLLFHLHRDSAVGDLDLLKTSAVMNKNLYLISRRYEISQVMFFGEFVPGLSWLPEGFSSSPASTPFMKKRAETPVTLIDSNGFRMAELGSVDRCQYDQLEPKCLSDGIEALIAAVLLSSGMRNACLFMKQIGLYSDQFKIDLNSDQENWFTQDGKKYSPLENDLLDSKRNFQDFMYRKYNFADLEMKIGYSFKDKSLLVQAFKHPTYLECKEFPSYERLEFLGDAVIDYLIVKYIYDYSADSKFTPGQLTNLKQSLTNNCFFSSLSVKYGLENYLIFRNKTLFDQIARFKEHFKRMYIKNEDLVIASSYILIGDHDQHQNIDFNNVEVPKVLGDLFESLMASIFIDSDFCLNTVWNVLHRFMAKELIKYPNQPPKTFLAYMYEKYPNVVFENVREENRLVCVDIYVEPHRDWYTGKGQNLKLAKVDAAMQVLQYDFACSKTGDSDSEGLDFLTQEIFGFTT